MGKKHIALITDDNYCFPTLVCIKSIINNAAESNDYVIHVCTFGLTESNVTKLRNLSTSNVTVVIDLFNATQYEAISQQSKEEYTWYTSLVERYHYFTS